MKIDSVKIKLLMAEQGISQKVMAEQCGVARQNISQTLARGTSSAAKVIKISKVLGVDTKEIVKEAI